MPGKKTTPRGWPLGILYLSEPSYAPHLTKAQHDSLRNRGSDLNMIIPAHFPRGPCLLVKITPIQNASHPANGQAGLFATRHLEPGTLILPYYGVLHSSIPPHSAPHEFSNYDLWLDKEANVAVDAAKAGNEARFVNDFRGVASRANAEFKECWDVRTGQKCMAVFVLPARKNAPGGIAKGTEIVVSYGKGFWSGRKADEEGEVVDEDSTSLAGNK